MIKYCEIHRAKPKKRCIHGCVSIQCKKIECVEDKSFKSNICIHNGVARRRSYCIICNPSSRCPISGVVKSWCIHCGGSQRCRHGKEKSRCKHIECASVSRSLCVHNRNRRNCTICKVGSGVCPCGVLLKSCKICNPLGHLVALVSCRVRASLKLKCIEKNKRTIEYLGCTIEKYKLFIEDKFGDGMTWETHGEWHIDHIVPIMYRGAGEVTESVVIERLHYTNTQPLWASENMSKGNRTIG
jgi:hypothetical protein